MFVPVIEPDGTVNYPVLREFYFSGLPRMAMKVFFFLLPDGYYNFLRGTLCFASWRLVFTPVLLAW